MIGDSTESFFTCEEEALGYLVDFGSRWRQRKLARTADAHSIDVPTGDFSFAVANCECVDLRLLVDFDCRVRMVAWLGNLRREHRLLQVPSYLFSIDQRFSQSRHPKEILRVECSRPKLGP